MSKIKKEIPKKKTNPILVNLSFTNQEIVFQACEELGFEATTSYSGCLLYWYKDARAAAIGSSLFPYQFANHFPVSSDIWSKVSLAKNFEKMQNLRPDIYDFHPKNFILPGQFNQFKQYMISHNNTKTFIVKPSEEGAGHGVHLVQGYDTLSHYSMSAVCQEYISPFLLNRLKFDFRIYVLITAISPFRVYVHNENMVRFCTEKYHSPQKLKT